jgi:hypothetical protein
VTDKPTSERVAATVRALVFAPGSLTRAEWARARGGYLPLSGLLAGLVAAFFGLTAIQQRHAAQPSPDVAAACAGTGSDIGGLSGLLGGEATPGASTELSPAAGTVLRFARRALCDPAPITRAFAFGVPIAFLLLMPLSAALMQLAFRRQVPDFRRNWVYGLEAHAALFLLLVGLALVSFSGSFLLGFLASIGGLGYTTWNVVRGVEVAYGVSARAAAWKTTAVGMIYAVVLALAVALVVWVLLPVAYR